MEVFKGHSVATECFLLRHNFFCFFGIDCALHSLFCFYMCIGRNDMIMTDIICAVFGESQTQRQWEGEIKLGTSGGYQLPLHSLRLLASLSLVITSYLNMGKV